MTSILERPFFVFVRGVILTVAVVAIPLVAIFWNGSPAWLTQIAIWREEKTEQPVVSASVVSEHQELVDPRAARVLHPDRPLSNTNTHPPQFTPLVVAENSVNTAANTVIDANDIATQQRLVAELENLGAQYYRLENWGDDGSLYRLSCLASPPGVAHYQKHFQVIDSTPTMALRRAITQIQQWHAAMLSTADAADDKTW